MDRITLDDGLRLAYTLDGPQDGPALLFLNSLGTDVCLWQPQVDALSQRSRIIRYDMRGHGQSDTPESLYSLDRLGNDALALLDHLGIVQSHVCGISLGGMVAMWLAAQHPDRVGRAILANTAARIGSVESWNTRIAAVRTGGMAAVRETVIGRFFSPEFRVQHQDITGAFGDMLTATDSAGYIAACMALREADLASLLPAIHVPTLIIAGTLDESTPLAQAENLHAAIAGSAIAVLPAAHLSNREQPDAFNEHMLRFLVQ